MDSLKEEFEAFKSSISRMRWFVTTAVLISVLILLHMYLDQFSFQDQQLATVFGYRMTRYALPMQKCYHDLAQYRQQQADGLWALFPGTSCNEGLIPKAMLDKAKNLKLPDLLKAYSEQEYIMRVTDKTIADTKFEIRRIPLLGVEVPANDFVPVMAMMSFVFVMGVWTNLRGVRAALAALANRRDSEVMRLARLNTLFLTALETERGHVWARVTRLLAIWLPFGSLFVATIIAYVDIYGTLLAGSPYTYGPLHLIHMHLAGATVLIMLHGSVAIACTIVLSDIDKLFTPQPLPEMSPDSDVS